jgi:hypothetical protein
VANFRGDGLIAIFGLEVVSYQHCSQARQYVI